MEGGGKREKKKKIEGEKEEKRVEKFCENLELGLSILPPF